MVIQIQRIILIIITDLGEVEVMKFIFLTIHNLIHQILQFQHGLKDCLQVILDKLNQSLKDMKMGIIILMDRHGHFTHHHLVVILQQKLQSMKQLQIIIKIISLTQVLNLA